MKQLFLSFLVFTALLVNAQKLYRLPNGITEKDYLPKTIILKVKSNFKNICDNYSINHPQFQIIVQNIGISNLKKKFPLDKSPEREYNQTGERYADLSLIYELTYAADLPIEKAISKLLSAGILVYAEPHFLPNVTYNPNDPLANPTDQYHLQTINAFNAWNSNKGDSSIVIGITDTGTDLTHSDLVNNIKRNLNDPIDGIDNDGDLYIDNYYGWDLGSNDNDPSWQANAHGVHVCGVAGASTDNNTGGAGVGFNCKIMPIKIADAAGNLIAAYEGIKYAADHGCTVVNCSWGGGGSSQYGQDIIDYATINKNCLVVAAAGNNSSQLDFFPAAYNYVLAVANTNSSDVKSSSSNFGYFVDVCSPGENIISTWPGNMYINQSGTSMASPVVAGAAGLIKNQFPSYNGLQLAERLKVTSDNIYGSNAPYLNKLGTGRINLFRALNDPATPSVVFSNKTISDHNDEMFLVGDTLYITGKFTNYLDPTTALSVTVNPLSAYANTIDNTTSLGVIAMMGNKNNNADPFRFKLVGSIPLNQAIDFEVVMQDGVYLAKQYFTVRINVDYINITVNDVNTSATTNGRIGYNQDAQSQGLGFKYKNTDLLYEAGLMIGADTTKVSDCVRGTNPSTSDFDFGNLMTISKQIPSIKSDFDTKAKISDNLSLTPLNVQVEQNTFAWGNAPNTQFVIWEYRIKNTHLTDTLKNMYAGIFADWDIDGGTFAQNRSSYDPSTKMGYCYYTAAGGKYAGIKLLTSVAPPNFYAIDNVAGGNGGVDLTTGYDSKKKYITLSTSRLAAGVAGSGSDNINVMSTGPMTILPGQTLKIAFALLGGDSLQNLIVNANQAQITYDGVTTVSDKNLAFNETEISIYPNPSKDFVTINQTDFIYHKLQLYSVAGQLLYECKLLERSAIINLSAYAEGIYFARLIGNEKQLVKKIILSE